MRERAKRLEKRIKLNQVYEESIANDKSNNTSKKPQTSRKDNRKGKKLTKKEKAKQEKVKQEKRLKNVKSTKSSNQSRAGVKYFYMYLNICKSYLFDCLCFF